MPAQDGDLYFTVESYFQAMVPVICTSAEAPAIKFEVYKNSISSANLVYSRDDFELFHWPVQVLASNYSAGDKFLITVQYTWGGYPARDYTVKVYSKQDLSILDSDGKTNMWHMDGQFPSAFTKSHYRKETTTFTPSWSPRSLHDIWLVSNNVQQFSDLVSSHPWTLFVWFTW